MAVCDICCENFNSSNFLKIDCKGCSEDNHACRTCAKKYILSVNEEPSCMFCKSKWDREFMNINLTKNFVDKELKVHLENVFLESQMSLLPETQAAAARVKRTNELSENIREIEREINILRKKMHDLKEIREDLIHQQARIRNGYITLEEESDKSWTIKCPDESCKGFLNKKYNCPLCNVSFCKSCYQPKIEGHECDEKTVETVKLITKNSKPCPGCGERISKIDGCDQMWCVKCHIQFSWRTGNKLNGYNHNPEYFRWMRETGKEIARTPQDAPLGEVMCNNILEQPNQIKRILAELYISAPSSEYLWTVYRYYLHMRDNRHGHERFREQNQLEQILLTKRIEYLLGSISKENWKKELVKIFKKQDKFNNYVNIYRHLFMVLETKFEQIILLHRNSRTNIKKSEQEYIIKEYITELIAFKNYINARFLYISDIFKSSTCPGIDQSWKDIWNYKKYLKNKNKPPEAHPQPEYPLEPR